jgi:hypothetical protein
MSQELKIIQDFYDFMLWMIKHIEKYPRHHRFINFNSFMLFMVNQFVPTMKDVKNWKRGILIWEIMR